jgi:hypothetical protein
MRRTRGVVLLGAIVAAATAIGQASAAAPTGRSARCSVHAELTSGQIAPHGGLVGSVRCGHPFGKGSFHGRYQDEVMPSPFFGSETGSSRLSFKAGALRGTYTVDRAPISGTAPFHGTFLITGGSGQFRHVNGTLKMTCAHRIPVLTDCTLSGPVRGL